MKISLSAILFLAVTGCMQPAVFAAELLDVKPILSGSTVSIEISADIPMTYTYYKVPGQARAVVDIAEADPEKVEPLIVVNKGAVSSISVDKAQISGVVVSRIIFNLVSESDISVSATPDRKLLTVTFGGSSVATAKPEPTKPDAKPAAKLEPPATAASTPPAVAVQEEDPLGLDEPAAKSAVPAVESTTKSGDTPLQAAPTLMWIPKLEPAVPVPVPASIAPVTASALTVKGIVTGASYIEIRTSQPVTDYKVIRLSDPERLSIDIPGASAKTPKSVSINKFGITKARIGVSPNNIRIVIDSKKTKFPAHTITSIENGLRINFK